MTTSLKLLVLCAAFTAAILLRTYIKTKLQLSSFNLLQEETAGSGIFAKELKLYRATESSLGELEVYSLVNGEKTITSGMYTHGLLDRL